MEFGKIKTRLIVWFLAISLLPLSIGLIIAYYRQVETIRNGEIQKLVAIRDLKVQQVDLWLDERIGDIQAIASDNEIRMLELYFTGGASGNLKETARNLLTRYLKNYDSYNELFILNADSGIVEISTNKLYVGDDRSDNPYYTETLNRGDIYGSCHVKTHLITIWIIVSFS